MKSVQTLAMVVKDDKILLGMKKRGFGQGKWNGFGGKVEEGEAIEDAVRREVFEESGIEVLELSEVGILNFFFPDGKAQPEVHIFHVMKYESEPTESEEMKPEWFEISKIPYDSMWADDPIWLPMFLAGKKFGGEVYFDKQGGVKKHNIAAASN